MADALRPVVGGWVSKTKLAWEHKKKEFSDDAAECAQFFDGPYTFLFGPQRGADSTALEFHDTELPGPSARMTVNKTAELVQLFGPALYHRNPIRKVNPRKVVEPPPELYGDPNDPAAAMLFAQHQMGVAAQLAEDRVRADILERYLNYTPTALDLKTESRWAIVEALVKGMGCLWTEIHRPPGAVMGWSGTFFDSVDNLLLDPDAETFRQVKWVARKRCRPCWEVERDRGLPKGYLKSQSGMESYTQQASVATDPYGDYRRKTGQTADLCVYYEVYSKMGLGGRLAGVAQDKSELYEQLGDWVYLEVCEHCPYPLNLPPPYCDYFEDPVANAQLLPEIQARCRWPTPYWADGQWPVTPLVFHWRPKKLWPMSHMKPGLGELRFLNWAWSFVAGKVRRSSRDFIAVAKSSSDELKNMIKHGPDYSVVEVEAVHKSIDQVVSFLQHPPFQKDIYDVMQGVAEMFDRRVGLTELMYGQSGRQYRSAQEAQVKSDAVNVRPDDMANSVEDAMTDVARKEAFAARWHLRGPDVAAPLGPVGAELWEALVVPTDPAAVLYSLEYRIEANSARKPNKALEAANMGEAVQQLFAPLWQYAQMTGNVGPVNALIRDWARSRDLDPAQYLLEPPPPPPAPEPAPGQGPAPPPEGVGGDQLAA